MATRTGSWLVAAALTLSAACAADKKPSDAGDAAAGDTIKVGGLLTKTSPIGATSAPAEIGARARFQRANDEGGVHGRKIDFIGAEDDSMNPARQDAAVKKLVQRDKVFAIVPWAAYGSGAPDVLESSGVSRFGWAISPNWCGSKVSFGFGGCLQAAGDKNWWNRGYTAHQIAEVLGGKDGKANGDTVWVQGFDNTESSAGVRKYVKVFETAGFKVAGSSAAVPAAAPPQDWLPYVNKIMKADGGGPPQVVFSVMSGKTNLAFYGALRRAGYRGMIADAVSYDPRLLANPQAAQVLEGVFTVTQFAPFESATPEVQKLIADVRKIDPNHQFTQHTAIGYWSADIFLKALEKAGKDVTRQSFLTAANSLTYENSALGKLVFPLNKSEPSTCAALVQIKGGKFVVAKPLKCFTQ